MNVIAKILLLTEKLLVLFIVMLVIVLPSVANEKLMHGTQSGKFFFFTYSMLGIFSLWSIIQLLKKEWSFKIHIIDILLLLFVAWVTINKYWLHEYHSLSLRYFELLGLSVLYLVLRSLPQKYFIYILLGICIGGSIQAVYGNLQLWGFYPSHHGSFKMTGSFFNPGPYAGFLAAVLPIAVGLYWSVRDKVHDTSRLKNLIPINTGTSLTFWSPKRQIFAKQISIDEASNNERSKLSKGEDPDIIEQLSFLAIKYLALITIIAILLVLPAARSRAAWLGAIAGVVYLALHKYNIGQKLKRRSHQTFKLFKHSYKIRNWILYTIVAIMLTAGSLTLYHFKKDSADGRMLIWTVTSNIIKDYPIFGVGQDMFKAHYMDYQADYFNNNPNSKYEMVADDNRYVFNEFLNTWTENGIIGLLLIGGLLIVLFLRRKEFEGSRLHLFAFDKFEGKAVRGSLRLRSRSSNTQHQMKIHECEVSNSQASNLLNTSETNFKHELSNISNVSIKNLKHFELSTLVRSPILSILAFGMFAYPGEILPIKLVVICCVAILGSLFAFKYSFSARNSNANEWSRLIGSNFSNGRYQTLKLLSHPTFIKLTISALTLFVAINTYSECYKLQAAYKMWKDAFDLYQFGMYEECQHDYAKAHEYLSINGEFLMNYGKTLSIAEMHISAIGVLGNAKRYLNNTVINNAMGDSQKALGEYCNAEKNYSQAINMVPGKFYSQYLLAKLYDESNQEQKAIKSATNILIKKVKIESVAIDDIKKEMGELLQKKEKSKANILYKKSH